MVKTIPASCPTCGGRGSRLAVPQFCPRHLEAWNLRSVRCMPCRGTGRADPSGPTDLELLEEWERGGGFHKDE